MLANLYKNKMNQPEQANRLGRIQKEIK
jgi:hypothetical protein